MFGKIEYSSDISRNIYNAYKEHNALNIFFNQNCIYFGWYLYPGLTKFRIFRCMFSKKNIIYALRRGKRTRKSFYRIIIDDLRARDSSKIYILTC